MQNKKVSAKFIANIERHELLQGKNTVIAAFSGGADSTFLAYNLCHLRKKFNFSLYFAHVNYFLRGADSLVDEEFVRSFAEKYGVPYEILHQPLFAQHGIEEKARAIRQRFFAVLAQKYDAVVLLGHNLQDQAETVIFNLARGAFLDGLKGMDFKSGFLGRPLLNFRREEIVAYLNDVGQNYRTDLSNFETIYKRNVIRHEIMPVLEKKVNAQALVNIFNLSEKLSETTSYLHSLLETEIEKDSLSVSWLLQLPEFLRHMAMQLAYKRVSGESIYTVHFHELNKLLRVKGSACICLPGLITAKKEYDKLTFVSFRDDFFETIEIEELPVEVNIPQGKLRLRMVNEQTSECSNTLAYFAAEKISLPLYLRTRIKGEKFLPQGMRYTKRIKDYLIDKKVSRFERDKVIILTDAQKILWLVGLRADSRSLPAKDTLRFLEASIIKE